MCIQPLLSVNFESIFLGSIYFDDAKSLCYDKAGNVYIAGYTSSEKLDSTIPPHKNFSSFILKLSSQSESIELICWLGGDGDSIIQSIQMDSNGIIWIAGTTTINNLNNSAFSINGKSDIFLAKYSIDTKSLEMIAYFGGSGKDECTGLRLDHFENPCIIGLTDSNDFNKAQNKYSGKTDGILIRFSLGDSNPVRSYYIGGEKDDSIDDLVFDRDGNTILVGSTSSMQFLKSYKPVSEELNILQSPNRGKLDAFLVKISPSNNQLLAMAILGGSQDEISLRTATDLYGNLYLAGDTESIDFLDNSYHGGRDFFVMKLNSFCSQIIYYGIFGGKEWDHIANFQIDRSGEIYVVGETRYSSIVMEMQKKYPDIIMPQPLYQGGDLDGFLLKINPLQYRCESFSIYGGRNIDLIRSIDISNPETIHLLGYSESPNFFPSNSGTYHGNGDIFYITVSKNPTIKTIQLVLWIGKKTALIEGKNVELENPPIILNGRTMVPLRFIGDNLQAKVEWIKEKNTVRITYLNRFFEFQTKHNPWMKIFYLAGDSESILLDSSPIVKNGRIFVPLRAIGEGFGGKVTWDGNAKKVTISIIKIE